MKTFELAEVVGARVAEPVLAYCLDFQTQQNDDAAVVILDQGLLLATAELWQQPLLLSNAKCLAQQHGIEVQAQGLASATTIRTLLHDAMARTTAQPGEPVGSRSFDRTAAQQALEDIVLDGLKLGASDIHLRFEPEQAQLTYRVDGRLVERVQRSRDMLAAAIAAALNTHSDDFHDVFDERRLSSASISLTLLVTEQPETIRLRVQKSPTRLGFAVTMRIQRAQHARNLQALGLPSAVIADLQLLLERPAGIILVVGPTGQGKTATLAGLNLAIAPDAKIISLEDPIEIIQPHIEQKPVIPDHPELDYAQMIKVAMREDPDVISVSEIRDSQTAQAMFTASLTGHLVTATLHAYDCFGALARLVDLGIALPSLAQPNMLRAIIAQRLVALPTGGRRLIVEYLPMTLDLQSALLTGDLLTYQRTLVASGWLSLNEQLATLVVE